MVDRETLAAMSDLLDQKLEERFTEQEQRLDQRFAEQGQRLEARFVEQEQGLDQRFMEQEQRLDQRFVKQEQRFDQRFAEQEQKFEEIFDRKLDQKLDEKLDQKLDEKLDQKLDEKLNPIYNRLDRLESDMKYVRVVQLENNVIPRLNTIEACYLDASRKFVEKAEQIDAMCEDIKTLQVVVESHSQKLNRISVQS